MRILSKSVLDFGIYIFHDLPGFQDPYKPWTERERRETKSKSKKEAKKVRVCKYVSETKCMSLSGAVAFLPYSTFSPPL